MHANFFLKADHLGSYLLFIDFECIHTLYGHCKLVFHFQQLLVFEPELLLGPIERVCAI